MGNIVYTKMYKDEALCDEMIAFGPISVHPEYQRKGIGKKMIQYTFQKAKESAFFMAIELEEGYLKEHTGVYHFDSNFEVSEEELEIFERNFPYKEKRKPQKGDLA